jgi:hypothetical protein
MLQRYRWDSEAGTRGMERRGTRSRRYSFGSFSLHRAWLHTGLYTIALLREQPRIWEEVARIVRASIIVTKG